MSPREPRDHWDVLNPTDSRGAKSRLESVVWLCQGFGRQGLACRGWGLVGGARSGIGQSLELWVGAGKLGRMELRESPHALELQCIPDGTQLGRSHYVPEL
jgi:hypothetical protein